MIEKLRANRDDISFIAATFLLVVFAYGLLSPWLGFYWDDWVFAWIARSLGSMEFVAAFKPFRPFLGPIFTVTTAIFGYSPFIWQLIGLLTRFALSLALWWMLRQVWPLQKKNIAWVVFLFTVFPGYKQQWVSLTHVNQELIPFLSLLLSFGVTAYALRNARHKHVLSILALALQVGGLFTTEYFFGLEIIRFFFILFIFAESSGWNKDVLYRAYRNWLPYLFIWVANAAWTYYYHRSAAYHSYELGSVGGQNLSLLDMANDVLNSIGLAAVSSWGQALKYFSKLDGTLTQNIALVIFIGVAAGLFVIFRNRNESVLPDDVRKGDTWAAQAVGLGLLAVLAGRLPSWAAGLPLKLDFDYDRFMVSLMLGASLLIVGLAALVLREGQRRNLALAILIGLSVGYQFSVSNTFRRDWENQKAFLWQLMWRIPALQENTLLLTHQLPLKYVSDTQITAPINWIYAATPQGRQLSYMLLYTDIRLGRNVLPSLAPGTPVVYQYRTTQFSSDTSASIVIYKEGDGCLRVLDPDYGNKNTVPGMSDMLVDAIPLSNLSRIQGEAQQPLIVPSFIGPEPGHDWCYYYARAEHARQQGDWEGVTALYTDAVQLGYVAHLPVEYLPFIEAFARAGNGDQAMALATSVLESQPDLCMAVYDIAERVSPIRDVSGLASLIDEQNCTR